MATELKMPFVPPVVLEPREWDEVSAILRTHLPNRRVWAFGSRATGLRVRRFSDLDLAVGGEELTLSQAALLREAFDESRLPFKVDVAVLGSLTTEFRSRILDDLVLLQE